MKKIAILSLCLVLLLAVCAYSAAADVYVTSVFNKDNPMFGGSSQMSSNPNADDEEDEQVYVSGAVTLANNGTVGVTVTSIDVTPKTTSAGQTFTQVDLNMSLPAPVLIPAGGSASVSINSRIPESLDAVDKNLMEVAFNVAGIMLKDGSGAVVTTVSAYMQRENNLVFKKVYVNIGEKSDSVDDEDKVDEVKPGDHVEVEATVENQFDDSDDLEIEDVEFLVLIDDKDLDVDEDEDFGDIGPEEKETESIEFDIEDDTDDDVYDMEITVEGEDENGAMHGEKMTIDFSVEKNRHDLKIDKIVVDPISVSCGDEIEVKVEITNIGKSDEDEVMVRVTNSDLEIDSLKPLNRDIDEGDSTIVTFDKITIPKGIASGSKAFTVVTYYEFNEENNRDAFAVEITCDEDGAAEEEEEEEDETTQTQDTTTTTTTGGTTTAQTVDDSTSTGPVTTMRDSDDGFRSSTVYILLLILAIIIVVVVGAVLAAKVLIVR